MKVLQVINSLNFGGAEKLLVDAIPYYLKKGIDVDVLLLNDSHSDFYNKVSAYKNVKILSVDNKNKIYNPLQLFSIKKHLKEYDLIHVHLFPALYWVSLANRLLSKPRHILFTEHNSENKRRKKKVLKCVDRLIYKNYDLIATISEGVQNNLQDHLGPSFQNIIKIYNGINLGLIEDAKPYSHKELNIPETAYPLIQISSFTPQKDQATAIRALLKLPENVHLILVGDGPTLPQHKNLVKSLELQERVHFLGLRNDVPRLVKTAKISLLSSIFEGFGLAILEGMAAKNACIGSNVPGLSEILKDHGLLFSVGNIDELANLIRKLISDQAYYDCIAEACYMRSKDFSINKMVSEYKKIYLEMVEGN